MEWLLVIFSFIFFLVTYFAALVLGPWNLGDRFFSSRIYSLPFLAAMFPAIIWNLYGWAYGLGMLAAFLLLGFVLGMILKKDAKIVWRLHLCMGIGFLMILGITFLENR